MVREVVYLTQITWLSASLAPEPWFLERPVHMAVSLPKVTYTDLGVHQFYSSSSLQVTQILHGFMVSFEWSFKSLLRHHIGFFFFSCDKHHNQGNLCKKAFS